MSQLQDSTQDIQSTIATIVQALPYGEMQKSCLSLQKQ